MQIQKSLALHRIFFQALYCKVIQLRHSYFVFQLKTIIRSETSFPHIWHQEVHPGVQAKLALTTMDKTTFCVYLHERAGFSFTRITNNIIRVSACGQVSQPMHSTFNTMSFLFNYLLLLFTIIIVIILLLLLSSLPLLFIFTIAVLIFF